MSILLIGGDKVSSIKNTLTSLGATEIYHWDGRKKSSTCKKIIPSGTKCVVMITSFLHHNAMKHFKSEAKKKDIPIVCAKSSASCVYQEYVKVMGIDNCKDCYAYGQCGKRT